MRTLMKYAAGLMVVGGIVLGSNFARLSLRGAQAVLRQQIDGLKSDQQQLAEARIALDDRGQAIASFTADVASAEDRLSAAEADLQEMNAQAARQRHYLEQAETLLRDRNAVCEIAGKTYSLEEVAADSEIRTREYATMQKRLAAKSAAVDRMRESVKSAKDELAKANLTRESQVAEIDELKMRLESARMAESIVHMSDKLHLADGDAVQQTTDNLRHLVRETEARGNSAAQHGGVVNWNDNRETAVSAVNDIEKVLR